MNLKQRRQHLRNLDDLLRDAATARLCELVDLQRECPHETLVGTSYSRTDTLGNYTSHFTEYRLCPTCGLEELRHGTERRLDRPFDALEHPRARAKAVEALSGSAYDERKRGWLAERR